MWYYHNCMWPLGASEKNTFLFSKTNWRNPPSISFEVSLKEPKRIFDGRAERGPSENIQCKNGPSIMAGRPLNFVEFKNPFGFCETNLKAGSVHLFLKKGVFWTPQCPATTVCSSNCHWWSVYINRVSASTFLHTLIFHQIVTLCCFLRSWQEGQLEARPSQTYYPLPVPEFLVTQLSREWMVKHGSRRPAYDSNQSRSGPRTWTCIE